MLNRLQASGAMLAMLGVSVTFVVLAGRVLDVLPERWTPVMFWGLTVGMGATLVLAWSVLVDMF